ncbi:hypothetical protein Tco_0922845 [Tanacetum coccineum]|uniref:Uncharacterized protein n=1 Tax=Tanacetum coccineum TaxID=301880 RepID=A0ABQ5CZD6_9ASTR
MRHGLYETIVCYVLLANMIWIVMLERDRLKALLWIVNSERDRLIVVDRDIIVGFEDRMAFVHKLESVEGVSVVAKTVVFLKEMVEKEDSRDYHLENLENEAKQRALEI